MKRLLILAVVVLVAGAAGCRCGRGTTAYRPCVPAQPCCTPGAEYATPEFYSSPDLVTPTPALTVPQTLAPSTTIPGPEAYTPAP